MVHMPFWLRDPLRRFVQYLGVFVASLPAGILYLLLVGVAGNVVALITTLPLALLCAYFAWSFIGKYPFLAPIVQPVLLQVTFGSEATTQYAVDRQGTVLAGSLAVVVFATFVVAKQIPSVSTSPADNSAGCLVL
jgi:hypothetical protein